MLAVAIAMLSLTPATARADDPAAEALYQKGRALMQSGKLEEACAAFEASMVAEASAGTLLNLAKCHEVRGMLATAWAEYQRAGSMFRQRSDERRGAFAADAAEALAPRLSRLVISVADAPDGLVVTRGGTELTASTFGTAVPVDGGEIVITAEAPGYETWSTTIVVSGEATTETVEIQLVPSVDEPAPAEVADAATDSAELSGIAIAGIVVGGVGASALVAGAVFGALVVGDADEALDDPALCPSMICTVEGRAVIDSAEGKALASTVLLAAGGALVAGGLLMILFAPADAAQEASLLPMIGAGQLGVTATGRF